MSLKEFKDQRRLSNRLTTVMFRGKPNIYLFQLEFFHNSKIQVKLRVMKYLNHGLP